MKQESDRPQKLIPTVENLSQAIFIVNRHAKTAPNPKYLYKLKHEALKKMLREGKAKKVGLHFSANPKLSQQQSDVLVVSGNYSFHIPPSKEDFSSLPHLGKLDDHVKNPKARLPLTAAKLLLQTYTGIRENEAPSKQKPKPRQPQFKRLGESYF
ncbi:YkyB family protein [Neobacillus sp. LXY-4]|uniref:YkyB family protein n=1 Tax=Neobacillus sp. LXY-4 TaxID=3379826 RepID=UPI003EE3E4BD